MALGGTQETVLSSPPLPCSHRACIHTHLHTHTHTHTHMLIEANKTICMLCNHQWDDQEGVLYEWTHGGADINTAKMPLWNLDPYENVIIFGVHILHINWAACTAPNAQRADESPAKPRPTALLSDDGFSLNAAAFSALKARAHGMNASTNDPFRFH